MRNDLFPEGFHAFRDELERHGAHLHDEDELIDAHVDEARHEFPGRGGVPDTGVHRVVGSVTPLHDGREVRFFEEVARDRKATRATFRTEVVTPKSLGKKPGTPETEFTRLLVVGKHESRRGAGEVIDRDVADGRSLTLHVGGGITWHSDPAAEWDETVAKARGPLGAIGGLEVPA